MSLPKLKKQVFKLSVSDRLSLMSAIIESLQEIPNFTSNRSKAIGRMRGLLKTDQPAPTDEDTGVRGFPPLSQVSDEEIAAMLEERRVEKYL